MPFWWPTRLSHEFRSSEYCLCIAGWFGLRFALSCSHLLCAILKKYLCGSSWFGLGIALPYIVLRNYFLQLLNMTIKFVPFPLCIETANLLGLFTTPTHISIMIAYLVMFRFFLSWQRYLFLLPWSPFLLSFGLPLEWMQEKQLETSGTVAELGPNYSWSQWS